MKLNPFKLLESIKAQPYELALVVPVLLDLKPASTLTLGESKDDEDTYEVEKKLKAMRLKTKVVIRDNSPRFHTIHLAKTAKNLKKLTDLSIYDNYNLGLAYGYPLTAVEAAKNHDFLPEKDCPDMDEFIITFRLSKEHWKDEYKLLQQWTEAVKKYTPKIYEDFMKLPSVVPSPSDRFD